MIPGMSPPNIFASSAPRKGGTASALTGHRIFGGGGIKPPGPFGGGMGGRGSSPPIGYWGHDNEWEDENCSAWGQPGCCSSIEDSVPNVRCGGHSEGGGCVQTCDYYAYDPDEGRRRWFHECRSVECDGSDPCATTVMDSAFGPFSKYLANGKRGYWTNDGTPGHEDVWVDCGSQWPTWAAGLLIAVPRPVVWPTLPPLSAFVEAILLAMVAAEVVAVLALAAAELEKYGRHDSKHPKYNRADADPQECWYLYGAAMEACKYSGRLSCSPQLDNCVSASQKVDLGIACLGAREAHRTTCFDSGSERWDDHLIAESATWAQIINYAKIVQKKTLAGQC